MWSVVHVCLAIVESCQQMFEPANLIVCCQLCIVSALRFMRWLRRSRSCLMLLLLFALSYLIGVILFVSWEPFCQWKLPCPLINDTYKWPKFKEVFVRFLAIVCSAGIIWNRIFKIQNRMIIASGSTTLWITRTKHWVFAMSDP